MNKLIEIEEKEEYLFFKQLYLGSNKENVYLLGYKLALTKTEYEIVRALLSSRTKSLSSKLISERTGLSLSYQNIAYHVSGINAKAKAISGRALIKNTSKSGYFLNKEM